MKSLCNKCKIYTNQEIITEHVIEDTDIYTNLWTIDKFQIVKCLGCDTIRFRKLYTDTQQDAAAAQYGYEFDGWSQELFPTRGNSTKDFSNVPKKILSIYNETLTALFNNQAVLCATGLRAIIEGICNDRGLLIEEEEVKSFVSLKQKIGRLVTNGLMTAPHANILHELRFLGNYAVHQLLPPSANELKIAMDILEHMMENIYELLPKVQKLTNEATKRKTP